MLFQIVSIEENMTPVLDDAGNLLTFEDGGQAARAAIMLTNTRGKKFQPRPVKQTGDEWKQREQARFDAGAYKHPLFIERDWFKAKAAELADQFVHISIDKPGMIAFTENAEHGFADRQTRLKPGKYLTRYFPELSPQALNSEVAAHRAAFEDGVVQFAYTADEVVEVYQNGPHSCMAYDVSDYRTGGIMPVAIYGDSPDLAVAYLTNPSSGRVSARTVCWPAKKIFIGVYGDESLGMKLENMGWREDELIGARMRRIVHNGSFICPYIDSTGCVHDDGTYLVIGRGRNGRSSFDATNTGGLAGLLWVCENCNEAEDEDDSVTVHVHRHETQRWCSSCASEHASYDEYSGNTYDNDICSHVESADRYLPEWIIERDYFTSGYDDQLYHNNDSCLVYVWKYGTIQEQEWTDDQAREFAVECDRSGSWYIEEATVAMANGETWGRDEFDRHGFECKACEENFSATETHDEGDAFHCEACWQEKLDDAERQALAVADLRFACFVPIATPLALPAPYAPLAATPAAITSAVIELQF